MVAIKICGISTPDALDAAIAGKADFVGLNFYPPSPRHVDSWAASALAMRSGAAIGRVGVFVDAADDLITEAVNAASLDAIQMHGHETPQRVAEIRGRFNKPVWKVLAGLGGRRRRESERLRRCCRFPALRCEDAEGRCIARRHGPAFRLVAAGRLSAGHVKWGLAGGLTPDNVGEAIRQTGATLVDTSSGVESGPGLKDVDKIAAFCKAARKPMTIYSTPNSYRTQPDERGHFGDYGGRYVAETLMPLVLDLEREYRAAQADPAFKAQFDDLLEHYVGRPSPLYYAERLTEALGGAQVWFKRDELNHTGAHKINNCIGQILLAMRMGKTRIIAETGAGQHGVATATVCARFGLPCVIYMGARM